MHQAGHRADRAYSIPFYKAPDYPLLHNVVSRGFSQTNPQNTKSPLQTKVNATICKAPKTNEFQLLQIYPHCRAAMRFFSFSPDQLWNGSLAHQECYPCKSRKVTVQTKNGSLVLLERNPAMASMHKSLTIFLKCPSHLYCYCFSA